MPGEHSITIQRGHCFRKRGSTGTVREQEFTNALGVSLTNKLRDIGWEVHLVDADPPGRKYPNTKFFLALHADGSSNKSARGASFFYPPRDTDVTPQWGQAWQAAHQKIAGYPGGFRRPNYVSSVSTGFYAWRDSRVKAGIATPAEICMLCEHYFATNPEDAAWAWSLGTIDKMADAHVAALLAVAGAPEQQSKPAPKQAGDTMLFECTSNGNKHAWLSYAGCFRYITQASVKLWSDHITVVPCNVAQIRALRATADAAGGLQDSGVEVKDFDDKFWEVPYRERPVGQNCKCDPVVQCRGTTEVAKVTEGINNVIRKLNELTAKVEDSGKGGISSQELSAILLGLSEEVAAWE